MKNFVNNFGEEVTMLELVPTNTGHLVVYEIDDEIETCDLEDFQELVSEVINPQAL